VTTGKSSAKYAAPAEESARYHAKGV